MKAAITSGALLLVLFLASNESAWAVEDASSANNIMLGCREFIKNAGIGTARLISPRCLQKSETNQPRDYKPLGAETKQLVYEKRGFGIYILNILRDGEGPCE